MPGFDSYGAPLGLVPGTPGGPVIPDVDLSAYQPLSGRGAASGYASLGADSLVPEAQIPGSPVDILKAIVATVTLDSAGASTNETTLVTHTIPAGTLKAGDLVRMHLFGSCLNNSGSNATWTFRVKLGGATVITHVTASTASGGTRRQWHAEFNWTVRGVADHWMDLLFNLTNAVAAGTTNSVAGLNMGTSGQITTNTDTGARDLLVSMQMSQASGMDFRLEGGALIRTRV